MAVNFIRFSETLLTKQERRVVSVTMRPLIADCSGTIYFTDLQIQEGDKLTGYTPHTTTMLGSRAAQPSHYNGIVRSGETVVIFNLGETSAGLDCYIYPVQSMAAGSISLSQGAGSHKATFRASANVGDEFALLASKRQCLRNGSATPKDGFYQYTAAHDSKHQVVLEDRKSARVYFEYQPTQKGRDRP